MSTYKRIKQQSKIVLQSRFLQNLSTLERYEFLQLCHRRTYKSGEYIFYRNDPGTGMYYILLFDSENTGFPLLYNAVLPMFKFSTESFFTLPIL